MKIYILLLLLFLAGCCPKQEKATGINEISLILMDDRYLFFTINDLISTIESSKYIERKYVGGWAARKSHIYDCYEKLLEIASDSLWVELSYSKSPVMKYYAYNALFSKGNINSLSIRNRLIGDTSSVCTHSCDIIDCLHTLGGLILIEERYGTNTAE